MFRVLGSGFRVRDSGLGLRVRVFQSLESWDGVRFAEV